MEAGNDWHTLNLNRLRSMKSLAPEFAKVCVDINNAKANVWSQGVRKPRRIVARQEHDKEVTP